MKSGNKSEDSDRRSTDRCITSSDDYGKANVEEEKERIERTKKFMVILSSLSSVFFKNKNEILPKGQAPVERLLQLHHSRLVLRVGSTFQQ
jgi:hypothetical protein